jgi:hypothetical protein
MSQDTSRIGCSMCGVSPPEVPTSRRCVRRAHLAWEMHIHLDHGLLDLPGFLALDGHVGTRSRPSM